MSRRDCAAAFLFRQLGKLWYVAVMLTAFYMAGWYGTYGLLLLAAAMALLFILMWALPFYLASRLELSVTLAKPVTRLAMQTPAVVTVKNKSRLPVPRFDVTVTYTRSVYASPGPVKPANRYDRPHFFGDLPKGTQTDVSYDAQRGSAAAGGQTGLTFEIPADYSGTVTMAVLQLRVFDYLGLFLRKKKAGIEKVQTILPAYRVMQIQPGAMTATLSSPASAFGEAAQAALNRGQDPYEIRQIRPYQPGDGLRDIHWKLSARTQEMQSKEYSQENLVQTAVFFEFAFDGPADFNRMDAFRETAAALSAGLLAAGMGHVAYWYDEAGGRLARRQVSGQEDLLELTAGLCRTPAAKSQPLGLEKAGALLPEQTCLYLGMDLKLYQVMGGKGRLIFAFSISDYRDELKERWLTL